MAAGPDGSRKAARKLPELEGGQEAPGPGSCSRPRPPEGIPEPSPEPSRRRLLKW